MVFIPLHIDIENLIDGMNSSSDYEAHHFYLSYNKAQMVKLMSYEKHELP